MALNKPQAEILSKMAYMNREYGEAAALQGDSQCFGANAKVQVHRFKRMFSLKDDLPSMMDALALSTIFANGEYDMRKIDENRFRIRVTNCL